MMSTDVDHPDFQVGQMLAHNDTAASVSSVHVATAGMTTSGATPRSLLAHGQMPMPSVQCLRRRPSSATDGRVVCRDHDVDVMAAAQAVVHHRQQAVCIGGR